MRFHPASAAVVLLIAEGWACSTGPSTGSTSSTTTTGTTTSTTSGTGGMDAGVCEPVHLGFVCGNCAACLQEKCCPELQACLDAPPCFSCFSLLGEFDGGEACVPHLPGDVLLTTCANKDCYYQCRPNDPLHDGGNNEGAGGGCTGGGGSGGKGGSGGNPP